MAVNTPSPGAALRAFVTGGAGFIGSHLVDRLEGRGEVTVYDNLRWGKREFISHHEGRKGFRLVKADLLEREVLERAMTGHDIVFHLAANPDVHKGVQDTYRDLGQGTIATYNVLEAMRRNGIGKLVFASSSTVYGETPLRPIPEDYGPLRPISLYGASKLACEGLITAFCHLFGVQAWIYRFANVVGARTTHGVVFDFMAKLARNSKKLEILGDGAQQKPYIHVSDCVGGMLYGLEHSQEGVNVFNLGCSSSTKVSTIASMLVGEMGLGEVQFHYTGGNRGWPGDVPQVRFDTSKIEGLGWAPQYTSDEAVRQAIKDILSKRP